MLYLSCIWMVGLVMGMLGVASNPAPYFAAFGLVLSSAAGSAILAMNGTPFLALVLFLIYLGGMLVVFGYSAALAADAHPESWGDASVFEQMMFCLLGVVTLLIWFAPSWVKHGIGLVASCKEFIMVRGDAGGVSMLYYFGGTLMVLCAWVLLLTLFVVLELTRGLSRGSLRAV
uniref:NADH-ubiquinone oxidoreductase chain 6 n=1 Tax=Ethmidium maculatum TaxID=691795 RepID=H1UCH0_ETHMA|nr:NADH dehydrogenase subunit 6 [Ethmidium maculatum]BAL43841.1 NADH dehydrogenase subunit 6 [Ethmidium maculatum]